MLHLSICITFIFMDMNQQFCFTHSSGEDIYLFSLENSKGTKVLISNYGAIITSFRVKQANGEFNDIVLGFDRMEDYIDENYLSQYPWFGCSIGRYANRIKDGRLSIRGKNYQLTLNNDSNQLHGGYNGFDKRVWKPISTTAHTLDLQYKSDDGEEGYPGNLTVNVHFELSDTNELSYEYSAACDQSTAINLTHHGYFNLENGKGTIAEHEVKIYASQYLEQDDQFVANGNFVAVKGTSHDFTDWKKVSSDWNPADGYDQSFVADNKDNREISLLAEARSAKSGIALQVWSTEPVVHFYTGKWIPTIKGKNGQSYGPYSALCLETQIHPNAVNIPHFPNTILEPGETYRQKTIYRLISYRKG
jgi:aldose 1-epimerase